MFGYIKPMQDQLRVCELEEYRAVYCGLCRALGKRFGPMARMTLSYDFTFVTMLALALQEEAPTYSKQRCLFVPFRRRMHLDPCAASNRACDLAVLLLRETCADNLADERFPRRILWLCASPLIAPAARRAAAAEPASDAVCREMTERQREAESDPEASIDRACDPTASALSALLETLSEDESERRVLARLGYMLGRYIYLCDAVDDLEKDRERGAFNPLLSRPQPKEEAADLLRMTIAEIGYAYDLLEPRYYKGLLDNILYLGLQNTANRLTERRPAK